MRRIALAGLLVAGVLVCVDAAAQQTPQAAPERRRIEIGEPGVYEESDCIYVMTKDVTAPGKGFTFKGKNYVVDLGGHTLTFNTEPYTAPAKTKYDYQPPWGVILWGENIELTNGAIIQGDGNNKRARCVFIKGKNCDVHHLTTVTAGGWRGSSIFSKWGGTNVKLHHNYVVCADDCLAKGIMLNETGPNWDVHNNTIVGGHSGISVVAPLRMKNRREKHGVRVHHNYISHKRTRQQKTPQGIVTRANGMEIDHNEICTIDGRGLKPGGVNNHCHHNVVDVRYTRKAEGGFYPENRCYGYWIRGEGAAGNRITDNLFVVNNEIIGDDTSSSIGILLCTSPGADTPPLPRVTVTGNRLIVRHNDKSRPALGFMLHNTGGEVIIRNNWIWSGTAGVRIDSRAKGSRIEGNTFVRTGEKWQLKGGEGVAKCTFKDNKMVPPPNDKLPPAVPTGLSIIRRFNGFELHWKPNPEDDVLGYYVYRDGKRVEDRLKCARFYVDLAADPKGAFSYTISAVDLAGNEGKRCESVSTETAK